MTGSTTIHAPGARHTLAVKKMTDISVRASRQAHQLALALLALVATIVLLGSAMLDAGALVDLVRFEASWQDDGSILVVWETSSEVDLTAFFVYRAESDSGPWDEQYIDFQPTAGNELAGATYSFVDFEVTQGTTYWYRLEEVDASSNSEYYGPIMATEGTTSGTSTPTATEVPGQGSATTVRQYTNTPQPAGAGTPLPTQTRSPTRPVGAKATPTRAGSPQVTTPTPIGGVAPTAAAAATVPEVTATLEARQIQPTASPTVVATPTLQPTQPAPTPSPTTRRSAATPKETSQPLLDASARQITPAPAPEASRNNAVNPRLALLLGISALAAAAILGALCLLIWRRRIR